MVKTYCITVLKVWAPPLVRNIVIQKKTSLNCQNANIKNVIKYSCTWKINEWKSARQFGKAYCGKKRSVDGKWEYNVGRSERKMKPWCSCKRKEYSLLQCSTLRESDKENNFNQFWKLKWEGKNFLLNFWQRNLIPWGPGTERTVQKPEENIRASIIWKITTLMYMYVWLCFWILYRLGNGQHWIGRMQNFLKFFV